MTAAERSILERDPSGRTALTVLAEGSVEYTVAAPDGTVVWTCSVTDGPRAQAHREAAAAEQSRRLKGR